MTDSFIVNWALLTVSLFNTILLLWLGLTVLLNAERRDWGILLGGTGLLIGAAFFVSHSALLGLGPLTYLAQGRRLWWYAAAAPAVLLPVAWYALILWYAGYWERQGEGAALRGRHRPWLLATLVAVFIGGVALLILAFPAVPLLGVRNILKLAVLGVPLVAPGYLLYIVLCMALSLDALRRPGPTVRVMGPEARARARPWLAVASIMLLLVSLLVGLAALWLILSAESRGTYTITGQIVRVAAFFDLAIATLIAAVVLLVGQAIVAYEVFTGKTLPRRGLARHWHRAILLAATYGLLIGGALAIQLRGVYGVLLTTLLMTVLFAVFSWRAYAERERFFDRLRPFLTSQRVVEALLAPTAAPGETDAHTPFAALCEEVLGARRAFLAAVGPMAPLVGPPLVYPAGLAPALPPLGELAADFTTPATRIRRIDPALYGGAAWAVPLWSERGLIGFCLLGPKWDDGVYTQEEIDIARTTGERLIDTRASAEMAQRLIKLQRRRLAESQVADRRLRRVLHDDILPQLHTALLALSDADNGRGEAAQLLRQAHHQIADLLRAMPLTTGPEIDRLGLLGALRCSVTDEFPAAFEAITWEIPPAVETAYRALPALTAEVVYFAAREAVRNAARHGRGADGERPLSLRIAATPEALIIEDDGVGLGVGGPAAANGPAGGGQGLGLHGTLMAVVGGTLAVDSAPEQPTRVTLTLPR